LNDADTKMYIETRIFNNR